ncbi:hypothetical protein CY0110_19307 [Crocosphaera chwakensis CCY0110]|uniref:Uncharacterized protein n=1 Tax=Crocosphaera chwakensis CCY0110 TaxID=391612 RepID=A3IJJ3_9CHRO|nr:hypothetical protein CY0110_19307 [Crocosphaera chwakensis CCY0110]
MAKRDFFLAPLFRWNTSRLTALSILL